ncbi:hypothetical protein Q4543_22390 [Salipiger sp. 1_MG-2023]|uniref:hypothetical protein n=1 Tax=Salipiger sp. 1_MG-2023 TaxID=3062665 RepID=UPI0026E245AF|nr:hypothetical protein [Salipiger sp. 1_MG-2023]MDO6588249.1 hypothetical protein [Salipiger sp. 1_MG-2023]
MVAALIGTASFIMMRSLSSDAPGRYGYDIVDALAADAVRAKLGLDGLMLPALSQWLCDLARLDFGTSLVTGHRTAGSQGNRAPAWRVGALGGGGHFSVASDRAALGGSHGAQARRNA